MLFLMAATNDDERRVEDRAAASLRVEYKRLNNFFADYTKNISKGGTFIRTASPMEIGTELTFVLSVPNPAPGGASSKEAVDLELRGVVRWVVGEAEATAEKPQGMGIQFLFADDAQRLAVEKTVEGIMQAALGPHLASKLLGKTGA